MDLKGLFEGWAGLTEGKFADKQWLLSKWEVCEGIQWPQDKILLMRESISQGLALDSRDALVDLGCGGGGILNLLQDKGSLAVGLDFSEEMLANAKHISVEGRLVQGAIGELPLKAGSFNKVLSYFVFLNFMDDAFVEKAILDVYRIIAPGGRGLIGQLPDRVKSRDYDVAKAEYISYCSKIYSLGKSSRDLYPAPQKLFDVPLLCAFLERNHIHYQMLPSFNPFYYPGEKTTVDWRFDLVLEK